MHAMNSLKDVLRHELNCKTCNRRLNKQSGLNVVAPLAWRPPKDKDLSEA